MAKRAFLGLLAIILIWGIIFSVKYYKEQKKFSDANLAAQKPFDYTLVFLGDSMTEYLGNFEDLRGDLHRYFPDKNFLLLNYGYSSTNILSAADRIEKESTHSGRIFQPINDIPFKLIFIESFGHNPLVVSSLEEGLNQQTAALDKIVSTLEEKHPRESIVFIATIAPNEDKYAEGAVNLTPDERKRWAQERVAYIKNHIKYAQDHNIPLINIYSDSLNSKGTGDLSLISNTDHIHPSGIGILFISEEIAKFLSSHKYLLQ